MARLRFAKWAHKRDREYRFRQEGAHAEMIFSEPVMREKLDYIHRNPVKRGYVDIPSTGGIRVRGITSACRG